MSYCVNCGVELSETEKVCPLCSTEVINPNAPWMPPDNTFFSDKKELAPLNNSKKYFATLTLILLLIPILVVLACDALSSGGIGWSLYVIGAIMLAAVYFILPMYASHYIIPIFIPVDALATALYLFLIERLGGGHWFLPLGLPMCIASCGFSILWTTLFKNKSVTTLLVRLAVALFTVGVFVMLIELIINTSAGNQFVIRWSQYVLIPCAALTLALLFIDSNKNIKESMKRRMFLK